MSFNYGKCLLLLAFSPLVIAGTASAATTKELARQVLSEAGVAGGLVVHLNCGDGQLTTELAAGDGYLVQGLDTDDTALQRARAAIRSAGLAHKVSVARFDGRSLPYVDNLVNLLVCDDPGDVPVVEVMRVLCPGGVAYVKLGDRWTRRVKPRPEEIDEWTHYLHDSSNNAVAHDSLVASPLHLQWVAEPKWARHHNHLSALSAMVSSGGRLFAIQDRGQVASISAEPKWMLIARDAFNGVMLWHRSIGPWEGHLRPFRSGPPELQRRLVAVDDRVYVTLGYGEPLTALDAATGETVKTYEGTDGAVEIVCTKGVLYVVVGSIDEAGYAESALRRGASPRPRNKSILAIGADSGELLWKKSNADTGELFPTTLAVSDGRVVFHALDRLVCLDSQSGTQLWDTARPVIAHRAGWDTPTLVLYDGVVLCADCSGPQSAAPKPGSRMAVEWTASAGPKRGDEAAGELVAYGAADGAELWRTATAQGYNAPPDVLVADGLVWTSTVPNLTSTDFTEGRDPKTGQVKRKLDTEAAFTVTHHHRCYRNKATDRFVILGRTGVELIDVTGEDPIRHCWIRGSCQYGVMPANGLLYTPPHSCACYIQSKLSGMYALAGKRDEEPVPRDEVSNAPRLTRGPAYGLQPTASSLRTSPSWPTYRGDPARSGRTQSTVPTKLKPAWTADLGTKLTAPVAAEGKLLVAAVDDRTVHALNAADGKTVWTYGVGGRVDSPPTIYQGLAIFGSADGYVYCLRVDDGRLVWRWRAAPEDRRTVSFGQVESLWPVTGSVLVADGVVYCTAGRSSYLDGGMYLYRLDPATGEKLGETKLYSRDPVTGQQPEALTEDTEMPGALPDVLSCDGQNIFLRDVRFNKAGAELAQDVPHMFCSAGLLDDNWWHRTYWIIGVHVYGRASGWSVVGNHVPSGRLLVLDEKTVFGFGREKIGGRDQGFGDVNFHLFRADQEVEPLASRKVKNNNVALIEHFVPTKVNYHWSKDVPLLARGMVLTDNALFAAGPENTPGPDGEEPSFDAPGPALLMAFSPEDGSQLAKLPLDAQPVHDGLIAADGSLYVSLTNGTVVCLAGRK